MHHRCMYVCVCMHVCRSLNIVLSKEVWKSSFDVSFLMRWSVPCVNTCNWPSTLRTVTGELLVVWTRGSAPAFVRLHWQSKRHGSKCVLCREGFCAGKQAMGLCTCLLLPLLLMEEHGHPFCQDLAGGKSLSETTSAPHVWNDYWFILFSRISAVQLGCWGKLGCVGTGTIPVCVDGRQRKVWKTDVTLEKYDLVSFRKTVHVVKVNRNRAFQERICG